MKNHFLFLAFNTFLYSVASPKSLQTSLSTTLQKHTSTIDTTNFAAHVDAFVKQYIDMDIFSGVILIAFDGNPIYHKPFGLANRETSTPVALHTKFLIGSMNKSFTQVVILQLIAEGKIKMTDKLTDFISGFKQPLAKQITIEHLLNHRSGFGDYYGPRYFNMPYEKKNIPGITDLIKSFELNFDPGSEEQYSNAGYILLGAIIEKITGKSYAKNVTERIIHKLNMNETYTENVQSIPNKSIGYIKTIEGTETNSHLVTEPRSDGGFWSTATDILTFYRNFFYGEALLTEKMKESMDYFKRLKQVSAGKAVGIAGGSNGINTIHLELPNEKISIVVLANMDEPVAEKISKGIKQILLSEQAEPATLPTVLNVYTLYKSHGTAYIKDHFESLTSNFHPSDPKDIVLNSLGYQLLATNKINEALDIFLLNTLLFPNIANCWDSYGEALLKNGDKKGALVAYKKALGIRPDLPSAKEAVKKLEGN